MLRPRLTSNFRLFAHGVAFDADAYFGVGPIEFDGIWHKDGTASISASADDAEIRRWGECGLPSELHDFEIISRQRAEGGV